MTCYVCGEKNWVELKGVHSQSTLVVCKPCGNLAHLLEPTYEKDILEYYRKEYRKAPTSVNIITTNNKLFYIDFFLRDFLKDKKDLVCGDMGAATGYVLAWLKRLGHKVTGSEYTVTFRRVAEHFYGIPLTEELRRDWSYDLIILYHSLEHMVEPDKKLSSALEILQPEGRLLISTPFWLENIDNAGGEPCQSFDQLYHKNHINLFSKNQLKNIFRKLGL